MENKREYPRYNTIVVPLLHESTRGEGVGGHGFFSQAPPIFGFDLRTFIPKPHGNGSLDH